MLTRDDLIDLILQQLRPAAHAGAPAVSSYKEKRFEQPAPKGRIFLSEYEIKKRLTESDTHLTIAKEAIISPLAADWLILKGIKVVRE